MGALHEVTRVYLPFTERSDKAEENALLLNDVYSKYIYYISQNALTLTHIHGTWKRSRLAHLWAAAVCARSLPCSTTNAFPSVERIHPTSTKYNNRTK
jgi:hypothetical protein